MDSIPTALRPMVKRLKEIPDVSHGQLISVIFCIRLGDQLHRSFYGTFLTQSLIRQVADSLGIPGLTLEISVFGMRWDFRQGTVTTRHAITFDYDMSAVHSLSRIALAVLKGHLSAEEGLRAIADEENKYTSDPTLDLVHRLERLYRDFPGRALVIPLMACTCATVYFNGTWLDLGFAAACGAASAIVAYLASLYDEMTGVMDYLAAIVTAMISTAAVTFFPDSTCFSSQVLGTLYWFLYGTAFVLSLYEITNNQLMVGVSRYFQATLRSYGLAFSSVVGVWLAAYGGSDRFDTTAEVCSAKTGRIIDDRWFLLLFPLSAIACLMQFRVKLAHFPICLIVQCVAYGSQYLIGTVWKQPEFLSNMIPALLATIASEVSITILHNLKILYKLDIKQDMYTGTTKKTDEPASDDPEEGKTAGMDPDSERIIFVSNARGYAPDDKLQYVSSDLWFCLLPALYLLVPGSKLLQTAFEGLVSALDSEGGDITGQLAGSLLVVALGQVVGLRIGFTLLWINSLLWRRLKRCFKKGT